MSEPVNEPNLQDITPDPAADDSEESEPSPEDKEGLPPDLVPGEDNPLAKGLPDGETADDLLEEGKQAEKTVYERGDGEGTGEVVEQTTTGSHGEDGDEQQAAPSEQDDEQDS